MNDILNYDVRLKLVAVPPTNQGESNETRNHQKKSAAKIDQNRI